MSDNNFRDQSAERFLRLVQQKRRGRLKVYLGLAAGVGKTYRLLQEAHELRQHGVDVIIGYVETHQRAGTVAQLRDLPVLPPQDAVLQRPGAGGAGPRRRAAAPPAGGGGG
jgi:two-component system sensor histidine kinase KdpD